MKLVVDDLSIYNHALSPADIQDIVNAHNSGKCTPCSFTVLTIAGLQDYHMHCYLYLEHQRGLRL
jgi:hypothetical protein